MEKTEIRYRKKSKHHEVVTALAPTMTPMPKIHDLPAIEVKAGRPKNIIKDFNDDVRSNKMGIHINEGLTPMEAGILAGFAPEQLKELQKNSDSYRRFVENELIRFKQKHLKVISDRKDPKNSIWLLEKTFPTEFAQPKAKASGGEGSNTVIAAIFRTVQRAGDTPIPTNYVDVTSEEEKQGHDAREADREPETSIEPGGANII